MRMNGLNHQCLKVSLQIVVWIYGPFDNNFAIKSDLTKYLKKSR